MAYEKTNLIPLGVPGAPWPTMVRKEIKEGSEIIATSELGVLEDAENPLIIPSARTYAEVMGLLYRNMPVRSMLPALEFLIQCMNPQQNNRVANLVSNPGVGKSFLAVLLGKARDPRGPIITDAGGKNLEYLLFQTVFDAEESHSLIQEIDKRLSDDTLDPMSVNALRKLVSSKADGSTVSHFSEENGKKCVDWKGLSADTDVPHDTIQKTLELVRTIERLDTKSMGIGFKVKKGPLVLAHEQGRDLVIDELNKCKEGTEAPLQIVWQVLNGEVAEHTVQLGSSGSFTFRRGGPGIVVCTGNLPKDGAATHLISESFDRRVPSFRIPDFDEDDWQDRAAQILTSLPIPMLHRLMPGAWTPIDPKNASAGEKWQIEKPEEFTNLLFEISTLGMDDEEKRRTKDWQMSEIANWPNVLEASRRLGDFYHKWSQLVDPDSALLKSGPPFDGIMLEISNADDPTSKVTPSTMIRHIEAALIVSPEKKEASGTTGFSAVRVWNRPIKPQKSDKDPLEANLGTRLARAILDEVQRISGQVGKTLLQAQLLADAEVAGLIGSPLAIATLLNVDPAKIEGSSAQAKSEQGTHAALLRLLYPDLDLSQVDEDILPLRLVQTALEGMAKEERKTALTHTESVLHLPNIDLDSVQRELFKRVMAENMKSNENLSETKRRLPAHDLVDSTVLLASLALPVLGQENVKALWNKAFTNGGFTPDNATAVAQNDSPDGYGISTVLCRKGTADKPQYATWHVLQNGPNGRTTIIGDTVIENDLYNRLKRNKIIYLDRRHEETFERVAAEVGLIDRNSQKNLVKAFLMRNQLVMGVDAAKVTLAELLTDANKSMVGLPIFITSAEPPSPKRPVTNPALESSKKRMLGELMAD